MIILAIETSCDETSASVLKATGGKLELLSNVVSSQIDIHKQYGGVVPEVAARHHVQNINPVIVKALEVAKIKPQKLDYLAVVSGPGLVTSLIVGVESAKALSVAWKKPLINVNHMYSHIAGNFLNKIKFPAICLVVSGGHTELVLLKSYNQFKKIGQTVDDAAGEAFDKVAKLLGLGYPGGPIVSAEAEKLSIINYQLSIKLPRPLLNSGDFNFSFSGLKTAVLYTVQKMKEKELEQRIPELCFEFQQAAVDVLVAKTIKAAQKYRVKTILIAGGVAANKHLREALRMSAEENNLKFFVPEFKLCTDNAAMVAIAGYYLAQKKKPSQDDWKKIKVNPNWELK
ncbi:MAG: tRNA (adenosine(37)-N6)-threonylcarbamoyltransferase complex transferase subunit TsaD [Patescibacteria group bacterium]|jgi:N6-L-threonylcarbamoyladenine synthase